MAIRLYFFIHLVLAVPPAVLHAVEVRLPAPKDRTITLAGGFAALVDPTDESLYVTEDFFGDDQFSYPFIFDTGASGMLMSNFVRSSFNIPLTGETFVDVGIGGDETFDVTVPTRLLLAPNSVGISGADTLSNYSPFGDLAFQAKRTDLAGGLAPIDVIGAPVINNFVMHVQPDVIAFTNLIPLLDYMQTDLLTKSPTDLPAQGVYRLPLVYTDFIDDPNPPVAVADNPIIPNVGVVDSRKPAGQQSPRRDWLLDTGGAVTIVGFDYASDIGIDVSVEVPANTVELEGVGGAIRALNGYRVDELVLPMTSGDELIFENAIIYVPEEGALPANLPGILGINLLAPAFSQQDGLGFPSDTEPSIFSDWYVDAINNELILVDPNSSFVPTTENGDLNTDGNINHVDIDLLRVAIGANDPDPLFNVNGDTMLDENDFNHLITEIIGTVHADGNLDGKVNFDDFILVSNNFDDGGTGWPRGNYNLDSKTNFNDFIILTNNFGQSGTMDGSTVPEPAAMMMLLMGANVLHRRRHPHDA